MVVQEKKLLWTSTTSGSFLENVRVEFNLEVTLVMSTAFCTGVVQVDLALKIDDQRRSELRKELQSRVSSPP